MKQVIQKAASHQKAQTNFSANIYLQYTRKWDKIPEFWKKILTKEGVQEGVPFQSESVAKVFKSDENDYFFEYKAMRNNFKKDIKPDKFVDPDFYDASVGGYFISPFSPLAFKYYQYKMKSVDFVYGKKIYNISVKPHSKYDESVFTGTFSIVADGLWIQKLDFQAKQDNIIYNFKINYTIHDKVWLPSSYEVTNVGSILGFVGNYKQVAKLKDFEIKVKKDTLFYDLKKNKQIIFKNSKKEFVNIQERNFEMQSFGQIISQLSANLSNKLSSKNTNKTIQRYDSISVLPNALEVHNSDWESFHQYFDLENSTEDKYVSSTEVDFKKRFIDFQKFIEDINITSRNVNNLPNQQPYYANYRQANLKFGIGSILFSRSFFWGNTHSGFYPHEIYYKSPIFDFNYNTVEGFVFNTGLLYRHRTKHYSYFEIDPTLRYSLTTGNTKAMLKMRLKNENRELSVSVGDFVEQFNVDTPIGQDVNSLSTLFLKQNYLKFYDKSFIALSFVNKFSNKIQLRTAFEYSKRKELRNISDYYWINYPSNFTDNAPDNVNLAPMGFDNTRLFQASFTLNYRPFLKYKIENQLKFADLSSSPLITLKYRNGIPNIAKSNIDYHFAELSINHSLPVSVNTTFNYNVFLGGFLSKKNISFLEYKHFNSNTDARAIGDLMASHRLVGYYENSIFGTQKRQIDHYYFSTPGTYLDIMTMLNSRRLLVTQSSILRKFGIRELISINYLYTPSKNVHNFELCYGFSGIAKVLRVEAVMSYNKYDGINPLIIKNKPVFEIKVALNTRLRLGQIPEW
ncbi:MAG: hypothetical protein KA188_00115 [Leadbetterella sp.]|nr:hypothetical protein [Leadbetterella sp.]